MLCILSLWPHDAGIRSTIQYQDNTPCSPSGVSRLLSSCVSFLTYRQLADSQSYYSSMALNSTLGKSLDSQSASTNGEVLFWESGMDRNIKYTVSINILPGTGQWGISGLDIFDVTYVAYSFALAVEQLPSQRSYLSLHGRPASRSLRKCRFTGKALQIVDLFYPHLPFNNTLTL